MRAVLRSLSVALERPLRQVRRISGGDISEAWLLDADGEPVFCKHLASAPAGFFEAEARGLRWLAHDGPVRIPRVLDVGPTHIAMEWIEVGRGTAAGAETLGRGLARLHRGAPTEGPGDNFIGRLPQSNRPAGGGWAEFYRERRLLPQMHGARRLLGRDLVDRLEHLASTLSARVGEPEPIARLHGDLWAGNHLFDANGAPWLIDPAAALGHREMDLAMMHLFGGFSDRTFAAYDEVWPLQPGWRERLPLYQLYYLLVHVNLFGSGWVGQVDDAVRRVSGSG